MGQTECPKGRHNPKSLQSNRLKCQTTDLMNLPIIIITGLSGSGKSTALEALEDQGFYCVDNMPVTLLPKFLELPLKNAVDISGFAFVMDVREKSFLSQYPAVFDQLYRQGHHFHILFLESDENVIVNRYKQTRRKHPLSTGGSLTDGIRFEKEALSGLRTAAAQIINTSFYNVHEFKAKIVEALPGADGSPEPMQVSLVSFGFKHGIPVDADLLMDVRFLANPYFIPELKDLTGENEAVYAYVMKNAESKIFLQKYLDFLDYLIPLYKKEGKSYLTIALGCTGGQHRSVAISRAVYHHLKKSVGQVRLLHRDIPK